VDCREIVAFFATHGVDPTKVYSFGEVSLTAQDVAAAMSGICDTGTYLLRAKYADLDHHKLYSSWLIKLKSRWGREVMVEKVCEASLVHAVGSNRCPGCHGVGEQQVGPRVLICSVCGGSGFWYEEATFPNPWDSRLKWACGRLSRIEEEAVESMNQKLRAA